MKEFEADNAMGVYNLSRHNKDKLRACYFKEAVSNEQFGGVVFIFHDPYRKLNIDLLFTGNGDLLISDYYGASMERESIFYVKLGA